MRCYCHEKYLLKIIVMGLLCQKAEKPKKLGTLADVWAKKEKEVHNANSTAN